MSTVKPHSGKPRQVKSAAFEAFCLKIGVGDLFWQFLVWRVNHSGAGRDPRISGGETAIPQTGDTAMFRKFILALSAAAALGAVALAPTSASAWGHGHGGWGHHWHGGYGFGYYGGPSYVGNCYLVRRHVQFSDGSWHWRRFRVCN
ncbi:MAG TPA: hypothetical protein VGM57_09790 [Pseudolabrys sp.]